MIVAIIPARSGSKRLPRKNTLEIEPGLSLVQQAIDCAVDSGVIDHTIVLSDDPHMKYERAHPMFEPAEFASDTCDIAAAVKNATERAERSLGNISHVVTLQPAVLARSPLIVKRVVEAVLGERASGAVTAARTVPWRWYVQPGAALNEWSPGPYPRSQDEKWASLDEINAVQMATRAVVEAGMRWATPLLLLELPPWATALDIDTPRDLARARDMWAWAKPRLQTWEPAVHRVDTVNEKPIDVVAP